MNGCNLGFRCVSEENNKKLGVCKALGWFLLKGVMFREIGMFLNVFENRENLINGVQIIVIKA